MNFIPVRNNFSRNFLFLISCAANVGLCVSKTLQIDMFLMLVSLAILTICLFSANICEKPKISDFDSTVSTVTTLLQFMMLIRFCNMFHVGVLTEKIRECGINPDILFFVFGCILCAVGRSSLYIFLLWLKRALMPFWMILRSMKSQFGVISLIYLIGISAIVRANYYYVDDMGRTLLGYQMTGDFSRYLSSAIATFLHGNAWLTDISPLSQWLAALIMATASILLLYIISDHTKHTGWSLIAVIPMGLCPYFLECYSYKFDAPYMALSVLAAIAPLVYRDHHPVKFGIASAIGTLIVCTTYQSSSGILPTLVVLLSLLMWTRCDETKKILQFIVASATGYVVVMLIFRCILMVPVSEENYVSASFSVKYVTANLKHYWFNVATQFNHLWLFLIGVVVVSFVWLVVRDSQRQKAGTVLAVVITLALMAILSFGVYVVLKEPMFGPRGMYGVGVFVAALCILITEKSNTAKAPVVMLGWVFFVFSFTYGNSLSIQQNYADFRMEQVLTDLNSIDSLADREEISVQIKGTIGHAPAVEKMIEEYGVLAELVTVQFQDSAWYWGDYKLLHYYDADFLQKEANLELTECDLPVIKDSMYHTIYGSDEYILIALK